MTDTQMRSFMQDFFEPVSYTHLITARDNTEECCREVLNYLCELLEQEDFPRSYAVEFKGPEKRYLPITGLPKKGVNQLFACAVQYPGLELTFDQPLFTLT